MGELPITFDHCVIHVSDWERARDFYTRVIGAEAVPQDVGYAFRLGEQQLNVHGPGKAAAPLAKMPVAPGNNDICFRWQGSIDDARHHLETQGVAVELGPKPTTGARGSGSSVYFRDPDGSLMEFISYDA